MRKAITDDWVRDLCAKNESNSYLEPFIHLYVDADIAARARTDAAIHLRHVITQHWLQSVAHKSSLFLAPFVQKYIQADAAVVSPSAQESTKQLDDTFRAMRLSDHTGLFRFSSLGTGDIFWAFQCHEADVIDTLTNQLAALLPRGTDWLLERAKVQHVKCVLETELAAFVANVTTALETKQQANQASFQNTNMPPFLPNVPRSPWRRAVPPNPLPNIPTPYSPSRCADAPNANESTAEFERDQLEVCVWQSGDS